jgi:transposase
VHRNARLNLHGRRLLIARIEQGRPIAHVADELGISRQTAYKWWRRTPVWSPYRAMSMV